jgi:hypothetical protein
VRSLSSLNLLVGMAALLFPIPFTAPDISATDGASERPRHAAEPGTAIVDDPSRLLQLPTWTILSDSAVRQTGLLTVSTAQSLLSLGSVLWRSFSGEYVVKATRERNRQLSVRTGRENMARLRPQVSSSVDRERARGLTTAEPARFPGSVALYVGNSAHAADADVLLKLQIGAIVCAESSLEHRAPRFGEQHHDITYVELDVVSDRRRLLRDRLPAASRAIAAAHAEGRAVLCHCESGINDSAALVSTPSLEPMTGGMVLIESCDRTLAWAGDRPPARYDAAQSARALRRVCRIEPRHPARQRPAVPVRAHAALNRPPLSQHALAPGSSKPRPPLSHRHHRDRHPVP